MFVQKLNSSGDLVWVKSIGGTNSEVANSIVSDNNGNIYITGQFGDTVDFDPGVGEAKMISKGGYDMFVLKLTTSGEFVWAKSFGGVSSDYSKSINIDFSGNILVTGYFRDTVDFDPGAGVTKLISTGFADIFIQKLDSDGNFIWAKSVGGNNSDDSNAISSDKMGNVYITGTYRDTVDFDPGTGTDFFYSENGSSDIMVLKLDASGNYVWAKSFSGGTTGHGYGIAVDVNGDICVTGVFSTTVDFDPNVGVTSITGNGIFDAFVLKLDTDGKLIWVKTTGSSDEDYAQDIATDSDGNIYVGGSFDSSIDLDPGPGSTIFVNKGRWDIFFQKFNSAGDLVWAFATGGSSHELIIAIDVDPVGNIYYTGVYASPSLDFNPEAGVDSYTSVGDYDIFVVKLPQCILNAVDNSVTQTGPTLSSNQVNANYTWLDCNNFNSPILGATDQNYTASVNGDYAVEVDYIGCVSTSNCYTVSTLGINEGFSEDQFKLYPNPTTGELTFDLLEEHATVTVIITDGAGKEIGKEEFTNVQQDVLKITEPSGLYLVTLISGDKTATYKVVKK